MRRSDVRKRMIYGQNLTRMVRAGNTVIYYVCNFAMRGSRVQVT